MKNSKTFVRVVALVLALVMIVPFFVSCSDKKKKGSGDDTSKDTKVNTLTGEVGADLMERFNVTYWREEAQRLVTGDYVYQGESQAPKSFEDFENTLGKGGIIKTFVLYLKNHAKLVEKSIKKISFTIEADRDVELFLTSVVRWNLEDKVFQNKYRDSKPVVLKANEPLKIEFEFDMKETLGGQGSVEVFFSQDDTGKVEHDSWQEWHLTNYKITDLKVIAK